MSISRIKAILPEADVHFAIRFLVKNPGCLAQSFGIKYFGQVILRQNLLNMAFTLAKMSTTNQGKTCKIEIM